MPTIPRVPLRSSFFAQRGSLDRQKPTHFCSTRKQPASSISNTMHIRLPPHPLRRVCVSQCARRSQRGPAGRTAAERRRAEQRRAADDPADYTQRCTSRHAPLTMRLLVSPCAGGIRCSGRPHRLAAAPPPAASSPMAAPSRAQEIDAQVRMGDRPARCSCLCRRSPRAVSHAARCWLLSVRSWKSLVVRSRPSTVRRTSTRSSTPTHALGYCTTTVCTRRDSSWCARTE